MQTSVMKGCDPEIFLIDDAGKFISSVGLIGGSKDFPMPIDNEGNAVQEDNVTVEFNIPPCKDSAAFIQHINKNKDWIKEKALSLGLHMSIRPSARFEEDQLATEAAQTFGCEPDFNAWRGGMENERPHADDAQLRSCGGHIHIALEDSDDPLLVVQCMDLFVGCLMLEFDNDTDRRKLYGKPGAFRKKVYGVEYRTASNEWIATDERIQWAWDQTDKAVAFARKGVKFTAEQGRKIQECINNSDRGLLEELKKEFQL
jgi:Phage phiEco32-like COOH.NH2 ligase-type 2